ncbi:MFS transporter [Cohnella massiliensis]|uniref:MFS transporter n=1 Tax=Cohnella massiliensis TaxID=1816691 RepID=UPI0009BAF1C0|nr:MFS transporter [Cohnella massiliensis]
MKRFANPPWVHARYGLIRALLFGSALSILSSLYMTVPLVPVFAQQFNVSPDKASLAGSAFSLFFAAGCLIYGPISDRLGRKRVIVAGLSVLALATLGGAFVTGFGGLIFFRCLQGAAAAAFSPVALTYAGEVFPPDKRITAIGFISSGFLMAGIFGQVWASSLVELWSWRGVFGALSAVYLFAALLLVVWLPPAPAQANAAKRKPDGSSLKTVLANPDLRLCYGIAVLLLLCFVGMYSALGSFLREPPFSLGDRQILGVRSVGIAGMALSFFAGRMCGRWGTLPVLRTGLLLAVAGMLTMGFAKDLYAYVAMSVVFVSGIAVVVPSLISLVGEIGGRNRATATSLYTFVLFVGASIGPVLTAALLETGPEFLPFLAFAGLLALGLAASFFIRMTRKS